VSHNIQWLGHDVFKISSNGTVIYTDPFRLRAGGDKADIILITHDHYDHYSPDDVAKIEKPDTVVVAPHSVAERLAAEARTSTAKLNGKKVEVVRPGNRLEVKGIPIEVTWAYNVNKFRTPGQPYHPKSTDFVGYIFTVDGKRVYLAGDTDLIPEMSGIDVDVALLPVSGTYVMTAKEAVEAANSAIRSKSYIPMHYNAIVGTDEDAKQFAAGVTRGKVEILPQS
jgi:L-ascorbate metabolism protein UlaG (beta-lactamase superfamily)